MYKKFEQAIAQLRSRADYKNEKLEEKLAVFEGDVPNVLAAAFVSKNFSTVETFWPLLTQYAGYLVKNGLRPTEQLCSDDFEGPSPLNANLAAKAIVGIATYAALCDATNRRCGAVHT